MKIVSLPAGNEPRKTLTVKKRSENLKEHKEAFEAVNQMGYIENTRPLMETEKRLLDFASTPYRTLEEVKSMVWHLHKTTEVPMKINRRYNTVARALGYLHWNAARELSSDGHYIKNLNYGKSQDLILSDIEGTDTKSIDNIRFGHSRHYKHALDELCKAKPVELKNSLKSVLKSMLTEFGFVTEKGINRDVVFTIIKKDTGRYFLLARESIPSTTPPRVIAREIFISPVSNHIRNFGSMFDYDEAVEPITEVPEENDNNES